MSRGFRIKVIGIGQATPIQTQSFFFSLLCHPHKRNIRELARNIPTANVSVGSSKPDLFDPDSIRWRPGPQGWHELISMLVDGQGMTSMSYYCAWSGVVEAIELMIEASQNLSGHSKSSNRIPHTQKFDLSIGMGI
jgi:hypothetical protein